MGRNCAARRARMALAAFALCFAAAALILLYGMRTNGRFYLQADWQYQQVLFLKNIADSLRSGNLLWSETTGLGSDFVFAYGFYNLFSPFTWLALPFSASPALLYTAATWLVAVRFGAAGVTAYLYIRTRCASDRAALLGCVLYAFSGWMLFSLNYHFEDAVVLFPLLLWGLDHAMETGRVRPFAFAVGACALVNYFLFQGEAVFLCLYFAAGLVTRRWRLTGRLFLRLAAASLLGVALAAVVLVPSALQLLQNSRLDNSIFRMDLAYLLVPERYRWLSVLRGLLIPAESIRLRSMMLPDDLSAPELWLPMVGIIPSAAWCLSHRRHQITAALVLSALFLCVPVLNASFSAFNASYYIRWLFCPILLMALAAAKCYDEQVSLRSGYLLWAALWAIFLGGWTIWVWYYKNTFLLNALLALVLIGLSLAGALLTAVSPRVWKSRNGAAAVLCAVALFGAADGILYTRYMQRAWDSEDQSVRLMTDAAQAYRDSFDAEPGRVDASYAWTNFGILTGDSSSSFFSSTLMAGQMDFYEAFGDAFSVSAMPKAQHTGLKSLLSVRYLVFADAPRNEGTDPDTLFTQEGYGPLEPVWSYDGGAQGTVRVYENPWYIPPAFTFSASVTEEQLETVEPELRHFIALKALVLTPEQQKRYAGCLPALSEEQLVTADAQTLESDVAARRAGAAESFSYEKGTYRAHIVLPERNLVFFSVPYSSWWNATVNGEPARVERVDCGLTAVECPAGECTVELSYLPVPTFAGAAVSAAALAALLVAGRAEKRRKIPKNG